MALATLAALGALTAGCAREGPPSALAAGWRPARFGSYGVPPPTGAARLARFRNAAAEAGLAYRWSIPGPRPLDILQTIGNGCAFLDYDADGQLDVLLVGSPPALYRGDGRGRFQDVSAACGLSSLRGRLLGCAVGDVDGDGFDDLYLSGWRAGALLRNVPSTAPGGRAFRDATPESGLPPQPWGTSAAFSDLDGDGLLDLYVGGYVAFRPEEDPRLCEDRGVRSACEPQTYLPEKGRLYRNLGAGRFADVTVAWGAHAVAGKALGVAFGPLDRGGPSALAIANDEMQGDLLRLERASGQTRLRNIGVESGTAYDRDGNVHAGMGIDWGDYDNDGRFDLVVTTFGGEPRSLYHNEGGGRFSDRGPLAGLGGAAATGVAFGCKFVDYDNDGWLDLMIASGHVQDNIAQIDPLQAYRQSTQLFRNRRDRFGAFEDVSSASPDLTRPVLGRGLAVGDYDNDGRVDALVVDSEGAPLLLHNETRPLGTWLSVELAARKGRSPLGAVLSTEAGRARFHRQCQTGGSYLSASDRRIHFGLGSVRRVDRLVVRWPDGSTQTLTTVPVNRRIRVRQGSPGWTVP